MAISVKLGERKVWKVNVGVASTGTRDHTKLENRDKADQHPINSISGLEKALSQKAAAQDLKGHVDNKQNPHGLTAEQVGARPSDWMPTAEQVGARPDNWMPSASEVGARPNTWLPTPEQIGAAPALDWSHLKWYVMGDSLTAQDNAFTDKRYYDFVQEKTGIQVIVDGVGATGYKAGESEGQSFLDRVKNIPEDVDIVTIFGSGNDLTSTDLTYANAAIYDTLAWIVLNRTGLRVIVVPPTPWRNYDKRGEVWKAYCDRLQVCALACDFRYLSEVYDCPPFNGKYDSHVEKFFTNDPNGVHPNEEGHKALAPYFYNALLQELALDSDVETPGGGGSGGGSGGAVDIPTTLPNHHKLTFTGAVTAEYDGSKEVSVKIPESGGIEVTGASVGQTIVVKAVDDNGKPTAWETKDFPDSGQNVTLTTAQINALDGMFKVCAFIKDDVSAEYNAFKTAFGISDSGGETPNEPNVPYEDITWNETATSIGLNTSRYQCWAPHNMQTLGEHIYYLQCHRASHTGAYAPWTLIRFKPSNVYDFEQITIPEFKGLGALLIEGNTIYLYTYDGKTRYKSVDLGKTWTNEAVVFNYSVSTQIGLYGIYKAGAYYYAGDDTNAGLLWWSNDGLTWNEYSIGEYQYTEASYVYFRNKYYCFMRDNSDESTGYAIVLTSEDGQTWTFDNDSVIKIPSKLSNVSIVEFDDALAFGSTDRSDYKVHYSVYKADGTFTTETLGVKGGGMDFHAPNICFLNGVTVFTYSAKPTGTSWGVDYYLAHNMVILGNYKDVAVAHYEIETISGGDAKTTIANRNFDSVLPTSAGMNTSGNLWQPTETPATIYASEPDWSLAVSVVQPAYHGVNWYMNGYGVNLGYADLTVSDVSLLSSKAKVGDKYFTVDAKTKSLFQMDKLISMAGKGGYPAVWADGTYIEDELMLAKHALTTGYNEANISESNLSKIKFVES